MDHSRSKKFDSEIRFSVEAECLLLIRLTKSVFLKQKGVEFDD